MNKERILLVSKTEGKQIRSVMLVDHGDSHDMGLVQDGINRHTIGYLFVGPSHRTIYAILLLGTTDCLGCSRKWLKMEIITEQMYQAHMYPKFWRKS